MFKRTNLFFERNYCIDFDNDIVNIDFPKNKLVYLIDFFADLAQKVLYWSFATAILITFFHLFFNFDKSRVISFFLFFYLGLFFTFNLFYIIFNNNKFFVDMQMFFEEIGFNSLFLNWNKKEIFVQNASELRINFVLYIKYELFLGENKDNIKEINYVIHKDWKLSLSDSSKRTLTITFKSPATGNIMIKYRGLIKSVDIIEDGKLNTTNEKYSTIKENILSKMF